MYKNSCRLSMCCENVYPPTHSSRHRIELNEEKIASSILKSSKGHVNIVPRVENILWQGLRSAIAFVLQCRSRQNCFVAGSSASGQDHVFMFAVQQASGIELRMHDHQSCM